MNVRVTERVNAKRRLACQYVKVAVKVKHRCARAHCNRSDKTVNQLANVFPCGGKAGGRQIPHFYPVPLEQFLFAQAGGEDCANIPRPRHRQELPYKWRRKRRFRRQVHSGHAKIRVNPCRGDIQFMRTRRSVSRFAAGSHLFEITFPATFRRMQSSWFHQESFSGAHRTGVLVMVVRFPCSGERHHGQGPRGDYSRTPGQLSSPFRMLPLMSPDQRVRTALL